MNYRDYSDEELAELYAEDPDDVDVAAELHGREDAVKRHQATGEGYAYCELDHPGGDAEAKEWCRTYHRPRLPRRRPCSHRDVTCPRHNGAGEYVATCADCGDTVPAEPSKR